MRRGLSRLKVRLLGITEMILRRGLYIIIISSLFAGLTYAAATGPSLWGTLDEPLTDANKPLIIKPDDIINAPMPTTPVAPPEKTTCQILSEQADLANAINPNTLQSVPDEYKSLVATPEGASALYKQYRDQYLTKYCGAK